MAPSDSQGENLECLEEALNCGAKVVNIRLREGEYQCDLAKAIAFSELELCFPNVKDLVKKLYGETKAEDLQFVSKVQTILKKMEKSGVVRILRKDKPWELQRYALSSFRFQDIEKNLIVLATRSEVDKTRELIHNQPAQKLPTSLRPNHITTWILLLVFAVVGSYTAIVWVVSQPTINVVVFGSVFCLAATCSVLLGIFISKRSRPAE
jgi:hypothetical protein